MFHLKHEHYLMLARKYGTPFYVYDADTIREHYQNLNSALHQECSVFYSFKANPNISVCNVLKDEGAGAEVCSLAELEVALKLGFKSENIIFVGPAKSTVEIHACIQFQIYAIVVESMEELIFINELGATYRRTIPVLIRINPNFMIKNALLKMGGNPSQFGIDEDEVRLRSDEILGLKNIHIKGIHIYNGTRILEAEAFLENTNNILNLAEELMMKWNKEFECIDIGGGFGVPYFDQEQEFNLNAVKTHFLKLKQDLLGKYPKLRLIVESGRYLVANAGMFVSKVRAKKISKGTAFLITDGGTHCHMAAVGINSPLKRNFPIKLLREGEMTNIYDITGPLCTPGDLLAKNVQLPETEIGDLIGVLKAGAYGPTASPSLFLSHGFPAEVMLENGRDYLIRKRDLVKDILKNQRLIHKKELEHVATYLN